MVTLEGLDLKIGRSCLNISTYGRLKISETISETFSCNEDGCNPTAKLMSDKVLIFITCLILVIFRINFQN